MANSPCHASDEGSNAGVHAGALRAWGKDLRWAWPRDGNRETLEGAGIAVAEQYKAQGLNMLHDFAHYLEGLLPANQVSKSRLRLAPPPRAEWHY